MSLTELAGVILWVALIAAAWWWAHYELQAARQHPKYRSDRHFARTHRVR